MYSAQTLIGFPSAQIGEGKIYRSPIPTERELPTIQKELKVTTIVQLCFDNEFERMGKKTIPVLYQKMEFNVIKYPIEDFKVPASMEETERLVEEILQRTARGENVLIHCVAGRGRTGLLVACIAKRVFNFETGKQAIEWVRKFIPGAVERPEQEKFVDKFLSPKAIEAKPQAIPAQSSKESAQQSALIQGPAEEHYRPFIDDPSALEMGILHGRDETTESPSRPLLPPRRDDQATCLDCFCNIL